MMDDLTKGLIEHLKKSDPTLEVVETPQFLSIKDFHPISWEKPMDNPRDTHFQGFAQLLWDEIEAKIRGTYDFIPEGERLRRDFIPMMQTLIARRAWDLAVHAIRHST